MKPLPKTPRYDRCARIAHSILVKYSIPKLPIDIMEIIENTKRTRAVPYSTVAKRCNMDLIDVCRTLGSKDGSAQKVTSSRPYVIHYNDSIESPGRVKWSISHEFGHIALGHLDDFPQLDFNRHGLSDYEYNVLEKEADAFAGALLAPLCLINEIGVLNYNEIKQLTGLSDKAAEIKANNLKKYKKSGPYKDHELLLLKYYKRFLDSKEYLNTLSTSTCITCNAYLPRLSGRKHCHICGASTYMTYVRRKATAYDAHSFSDDMKNKCTSISCHEALQNNSRFCYKCGSASMFFKENYLKPWNHKVNSEIIVKGEYNMFLELKPEVVYKLQQLLPRELKVELKTIVSENLPQLKFKEMRVQRIVFEGDDNLYRASLRSDGLHMIRLRR